MEWKRQDVRVEAVVADHSETFFGKGALGFEDVVEILHAIDPHQHHDDPRARLDQAEDAKEVYD